MILNRVVTRFWQSSFLSLTWGFSLISPSGSCCPASRPCQPHPALHSAFYFALDHSTSFTGLYWGAWVTITTYQLPVSPEVWVSEAGGKRMGCSEKRALLVRGKGATMAGEPELGWAWVGCVMQGGGPLRMTRGWGVGRARPPYCCCCPGERRRPWEGGEWGWREADRRGAGSGAINGENVKGE